MNRNQSETCDYMKIMTEVGSRESGVGSRESEVGRRESMASALTATRKFEIRSCKNRWVNKSNGMSFTFEKQMIWQKAMEIT